MMQPTEQYIASLLPDLLALLRTEPAGISEFDLIRKLQKAQVSGFGAEALREPLSLYRTHFLLFHCLYRLREQLIESGETLDVNCLRIRIRPLSTAKGALGAPDPLRGFYLDLANYTNVDAAEVERMMGGFWRLFSRSSERGDALAVLGLADPVSRSEIKQQYRRLAMQHHPDRGGDTAKLQELNAAIAVLEV